MSNWISVAFAQEIYRICYFLQKEKLVLRSLLSEGRYLFIYLFIFWGGRGESLLPGFANTCDILSLLSEVRYFRWSMGRYFRNFTVALLVPNDAQSGFSSLPNDVG